jgi:lipid-binding SYLF domain-containing protein
MKAKLYSIAAVTIAACLIVASAQANYQDDVDQAVAIIESFENIPERAIPTAVLRQARGLAILTVTKAGFIVSGRGGKGVERSLGDRYGRHGLRLSGWSSGL